MPAGSTEGAVRCAYVPELPCMRLLLGDQTPAHTHIYNNRLKRIERDLDRVNRCTAFSFPITPRTATWRNKACWPISVHTETVGGQLTGRKGARVCAACSARIHSQRVSERRSSGVCVRSKHAQNTQIYTDTDTNNQTRTPPPPQYTHTHSQPATHTHTPTPPNADVASFSPIFPPSGTRPVCRCGDGGPRRCVWARLRVCLCAVCVRRRVCVCVRVCVRRRVCVGNFFFFFFFLDLLTRSVSQVISLYLW